MALIVPHVLSRKTRLFRCGAFRHHFGPLIVPFACLVQRNNEPTALLWLTSIFISASSSCGFISKNLTTPWIGLFPLVMSIKTKLSSFLDGRCAIAMGSFNPMCLDAQHTSNMAQVSGNPLPGLMSNPLALFFKPHPCQALRALDNPLRFWTCKTCARKPLKGSAHGEIFG